MNREKLLADREKLEAQIKALKVEPVGRSNAAQQGRLEDLKALAHKVVLIDRKLGRCV